MNFHYVSCVFTLFCVTERLNMNDFIVLDNDQRTPTKVVKGSRISCCTDNRRGVIYLQEVGTCNGYNFPFLQNL